VGDRASDPKIARVIKRVMKGVSVVMRTAPADLTEKEAARALARELQRDKKRKLTAEVWKRDKTGWRVELASGGKSLGYLRVSAGASPVEDRSKLGPAVVAEVVESAIGGARVNAPTDPAQRARLLAAIAADPGDDGPRGVYADWLMEQAEPIDRARGEFIAAQLAGAKGAGRAHELEQLHGDAWAKGFRQARSQQWQYARGMLDTISMHVDHFTGRMLGLLVVEPVVRVVRIGGSVPEERMLPIPVVAKTLPALEELDLTRIRMPATLAKALLGAKLPRLKILNVGYCQDPELRAALKKKYARV
jgi:uncharacterized protein (TIGR02996 family)